MNSPSPLQCYILVQWWRHWFVMFANLFPCSWDFSSFKCDPKCCVNWNFFSYWFVKIDGLQITNICSAIWSQMMCNKETRTWSQDASVEMMWGVTKKDRLRTKGIRRRNPQVASRIERIQEYHLCRTYFVQQYLWDPIGPMSQAVTQNHCPWVVELF